MDWRGFLSDSDYHLVRGFTGNHEHGPREPDLIIAPDGKPYIYRWHLLRSEVANTYLHIQVASDPERPLHDHPWDNFSNILSGGYDEMWAPQPWLDDHGALRKLRKGDCVSRSASEAHRLILPAGVPYTISMFSTGAKKRDWGFWYPDGWRPFTAVTRLDGNVSTHIKDHHATDTAPAV